MTCIISEIIMTNLLLWSQAVSTVILVFITGVYAFLTWRILIASKKASKNEKMPVLIFRFLEESHPVQISERIVNVGSGPALDIYLESNGIFQNNQLTGFSKNSNLKKWPLPVYNCIGPDNGNPNLQVCFLVTKQGLSVFKNHDAEFLLTYKDVFGRTFKTRFVNQENKFEVLI